MTLYFIGLGLGDEKDITVKGLEAVRRCKEVYLENYTSIMEVDWEVLSAFYGKDIKLANRELVEKKAEETILKHAKESDIAFLVIGDPMCATTHLDLMTRAREQDIEIKIIHNASILNAIGEVGLELYKYGRTPSISFDENATSFYDFFKKNQAIDLHTLFLLDLSPKDNKFLTINKALERLLKLGLDKNQLCIGCAGIGSNEQIIKAGKAEKLKEESFDIYPQCLILPGKLHFMEEEALERWKK